MSQRPRVRRVRFYFSATGRKVAKEEFLNLSGEGQTALHDLFTRYENGQERHHEVRLVEGGLWEFRVQVGTNPYRAYFFKDGPKYVIVLLCAYKNQQKASKAVKNLAKDRMANWRSRGGARTAD